MYRNFVAGAAIWALMSGSALSQPAAPSIDGEMLSRVAGACTAGSAFGRPLGQPSTGPTMLRLAEWKPFDHATLVVTPRSQKLTGVDTVASFENDPGDFESRSRSAKALFQALDAKIQADGRFAQREVEDEDNVTYTNPGPGGVGGLEFSLMRMGVGVWLSCADLGVRKLAMDEAFGRVRVDKPTPPTLNLPPRPAADACADPVQRAALAEDFGSAMTDVFSYAEASSRYAEHLADWKGQQLIDKRVWTKQRQLDFAMSALSDPVIGPEFEKNMDRVLQLLDIAKAYADADEAGDEAKACAATVRGVGLMYDAVASNERQWKRMHERYDAEARRLKVVLE